MVRNANSVMRRSHNYGTVIPRDLNYGLKCSLYSISYMYFCVLTLYRAKMNRKQNIKNIHFFPKILFLIIFGFPVILDL